VLDAAVAVSAGGPVPEHVTTAFGGLAEAMRRGDARASKVDRAVIDLVEAVALRGREGERFEAVVIDVDDRDGARVQLRDVAVVARIDRPGSTPGDAVTLKLVAADPAARRVEFTPS
jgi:exoribonuclease R